MKTAIVWLRRDLRLVDNPALAAAASASERVLPVYLWTPEEDGGWAPGGAQRWWLHASLHALDARLRRRGGQLVFGRGEALSELRRIVAATGASAVYWNRLYEPATIDRDRQVKAGLRADGLEVRSFGAGLLFEPWTVQTAQGKPYRVFTQFWKTCRKQPPPPRPLAAPGALSLAPAPAASLQLDALELLPRQPWHEALAAEWRPGEKDALRRLDEFLERGLADYHDSRDRPDADGTSRLSPHLHFGELSPRSAWHAAAAAGARSRYAAGASAFARELGWREFAHHVLYHFPHTPDQPLNERFRLFPWRDDETRLGAWQSGETGLPIVDAGMRQLWQTGWMHNRVRMIVASLLVKNLRIDWRHGSRWFWDTLVDADLANNTMGWQWSAGCGADAAPYFRIFNPVLQGERFDPDGRYVRRYVPELADVPDAAIHKPWTLGASDAAAGGFRPGRDYPLPIVDLKTSRAEALAALRSLPAR